MSENTPINGVQVGELVEFRNMCATTFRRYE